MDICIIRYGGFIFNKKEKNYFKKNRNNVR